jgi:hypothetical protein
MDGQMLLDHDHESPGRMQRLVAAERAWFNARL